MTARLLLRTHYDLSAARDGGARTLMRNLVDALDESGWDVEVLCPQVRGASPPDNGVTYRRFDYGEPNSAVETVLNTVRGARTYYHLSRRSAFDVVLDDVSHYPFYPVHFLCPEETTNALFMHTAFFGAAREYVGPFRGTVVDAIDRTLPYLNDPEIVCAGPSTERRIHEKTGYRRTHVLNPCIHLDRIDYCFDPDSTQIVYLGRLGVRKNVSSLLRAWELVERVGFEEYSLVVAGSGSRERALRKLATDLDLERVEFAGHVSEEYKRRLLTESLLCVIPSKMEGYVTTGLEALAAGTPVVGADTYGINDYVVEGETGYLFDVDDHSHLAERLGSLLADPASIGPIARTGREVAAAHRFEAFREQAVETFERIAGRSDHDRPGE